MEYLKFTLWIIIFFSQLAKGETNLIVSLKNLPKSKDPRESFNYQQFLVLECIYNSPLNISSSGEITSEIIKKWEFSDGHKKLKVNLDNEYTFHNNIKVKSEDVAYSLSMHLWPTSKSVIKNYLYDIVGAQELVKEQQIIKGIEIVNNEEIIINFSRPAPHFLYVLTMPGFAVVNYKELLKNNFVGTGRLIPSSWENNFIKLKNWSQYKGTKPELLEIQFHSTPNELELIEKLSSKKIDISIGEIANEKISTTQIKDYIVSHIKTLGILHLYFNTSNTGNLSSKDDRKRIYAIVQNTLTENIKLFPAKQIYNFIPPGVMPLQYYKKNEIKLSDTKKNLKVDIVLSNHLFPKEFAYQLQNNLNKNNINANIRLVTQDEYSQIQDSKKYDLISGGYFGNFPDPLGFAGPLMRGNKASYGIFPTEELFQEIAKANETKSSLERLNQLSKIFNKFEEEYNFIPMMQFNFPYIHHKNISVPNSEYRYESEMWKIIWNNPR